MKILCLYGNECALSLFEWLKHEGHEITLWKKSLTVGMVESMYFDLTVSYTYQYIIGQDVIDALRNNVVNIHTSYLPYNRGSYPNIFSIIDHSPRGVTLHYINAGVDEGDIIAQKIVQLKPDATLKTSYDELDTEAKRLFMTAFEYYEYWNTMRKKPICMGSVHKEKEFLKIKNEFENWDWNMKVSDFLSIVRSRYRGITADSVHNGGCASCMD